jgi:hypothetical protein
MTTHTPTKAEELHEEPCWNCGRPSEFLSAGAAFCSEDCAEEFMTDDGTEPLGLYDEFSQDEINKMIS